MKLMNPYMEDFAGMTPMGSVLTKQKFVKPTYAQGQQQGGGTSFQSIADMLANSSYAGLSGGNTQNLLSLMNQIAPKSKLQTYSGATDVPLTQGQQAMGDLVTQLASGSYGNLRQMLSGTPDWGSFQRGVVDPMQRQFKNETIPGIQEAYSGGPYGSNYWSGTRAKAQAGAQNQLNDALAQARYQELAAAKNRGLQAAQTLPGLNSVLQGQAQQMADNLSRQISVHYQNQGLSQQQFTNDMSRLTALLSMSNQDLQAQELRSGDLRSLLAALGSRDAAQGQLGLGLRGQDIQSSQFQQNYGLAQDELALKRASTATIPQQISLAQAMNAANPWGNPRLNLSNVLRA